MSGYSSVDAGYYVGDGGSDWDYGSTKFSIATYGFYEVAHSPLYTKCKDVSTQDKKNECREFLKNFESLCNHWDHTAYGYFSFWNTFNSFFHFGDHLAPVRAMKSEIDGQPDVWDDVDVDFSDVYWNTFKDTNTYCNMIPYMILVAIMFVVWFSIFINLICFPCQKCRDCWGKCCCKLCCHDRNRVAPFWGLSRYKFCCLFCYNTWFVIFTTFVWTALMMFMYWHSLDALENLDCGIARYTVNNYMSSDSNIGELKADLEKLVLDIDGQSMDISAFPQSQDTIDYRNSALPDLFAEEYGRKLADMLSDPKADAKAYGDVLTSLGLTQSPVASCAVDTNQISNCTGICNENYKWTDTVYGDTVDDCNKVKAAKAKTYPEMMSTIDGNTPNDDNVPDLWMLTANIGYNGRYNEWRNKLDKRINWTGIAKSFGMAHTLTRDKNERYDGSSMAYRTYYQGHMNYQGNSVDCNNDNKCQRLASIKYNKNGGDNPYNVQLQESKKLPNDERDVGYFYRLVERPYKFRSQPVYDSLIYGRAVITQIPVITEVARMLQLDDQQLEPFEGYLMMAKKCSTGKVAFKDLCHTGCMDRFDRFSMEDSFEDKPSKFITEYIEDICPYLNNDALYGDSTNVTLANWLAYYGQLPQILRMKPDILDKVRGDFKPEDYENIKNNSSRTIKGDPTIVLDYHDVEGLMWYLDEAKDVEHISLRVESPDKSGEPHLYKRHLSPTPFGWVMEPNSRAHLPLALFVRINDYINRATSEMVRYSTKVDLTPLSDFAQEMDNSIWTMLDKLLSFRKQIPFVNHKTPKRKHLYQDPSTQMIVFFWLYVGLSVFYGLMLVFWALLIFTLLVLWCKYMRKQDADQRKAGQFWRSFYASLMIIGIFWLLWGMAIVLGMPLSQLFSKICRKSFEGMDSSEYDWLTNKVDGWIDSKMHTHTGTSTSAIFPVYKGFGQCLFQGKQVEVDGIDVPDEVDVQKRGVQKFLLEYFGYKVTDKGDLVKGEGGIDTALFSNNTLGTNSMINYTIQGFYIKTGDEMSDIMAYVQDFKDITDMIDDAKNTLIPAIDNGLLDVVVETVPGLVTASDNETIINTNNKIDGIYLSAAASPLLRVVSFASVNSTHGLDGKGKKLVNDLLRWQRDLVDGYAETLKSYKYICTEGELSIDYGKQVGGDLAKVLFSDQNQILDKEKVATYKENIKNSTSSSLFVFDIDNLDLSARFADVDVIPSFAQAAHNYLSELYGGLDQIKKPIEDRGEFCPNRTPENIMDICVMDKDGKPVAGHCIYDGSFTWNSDCADKVKSISGRYVCISPPVVEGDNVRISGIVPAPHASGGMGAYWNDFPGYLHQQEGRKGGYIGFSNGGVFISPAIYNETGSEYTVFFENYKLCLSPLTDADSLFDGTKDFTKLIEFMGSLSMIQSHISQYEYHRTRHLWLAVPSSDGVTPARRVHRPLGSVEMTPLQQELQKSLMRRDVDSLPGSADFDDDVSNEDYVKDLVTSLYNGIDRTIDLTESMNEVLDCPTLSAVFKDTVSDGCSVPLGFISYFMWLNFLLAMAFLVMYFFGFKQFHYWLNRHQVESGPVDDILVASYYNDPEQIKSIWKSEAKLPPESTHRKVFTRDSRGNTALHMAAFRGHDEMCLQLLQHGADPNAKNDGFYAPLHVAAYENHYNCVQTLLNNGADPNSLDEYDDTPLVGVVRSGQHQMAEILLQGGSDPLIPDAKGYLCLQIAEYRNDDEMVSILKEHQNAEAYKAKMAELDRQQNETYRQPYLGYTSRRTDFTESALYFPNGTAPTNKVKPQTITEKPSSSSSSSSSSSKSRGRSSSSSKKDKERSHKHKHESASSNSTAIGGVAIHEPERPSKSKSGSLGD